MEWKLADAKNRLSELIKRVKAEGPQWIRRRNDAFVVLDADEYQQLIGDRPSLKRMILDGPNLDGVDLDRDQSHMRDLEL